MKRERLLITRQLCFAFERDARNEFPADEEAVHDMSLTRYRLKIEPLIEPPAADDSGDRPTIGGC